MKKIRIWFSDFWVGFDMKANFISDILSTKYIIELTNEPDYLIYSSYGSQFVNFDCVRIFYTGEPHSPNFNLCDYAIGYDFLEYGDRYLRWPYFRTYKDGIQTKLPVELRSKGFCSYVYSNLYTPTERSLFMKKLSSYKVVSSGGKDNNNIGYIVNNKHEFLSLFKFSIVYENSLFDGYTSEKIVDAFNASTIPIYYGNSKIFLDVNRDAIISAHDFKSTKELIDYIIELDNNEMKYDKVLNASPKILEYDKKGIDHFLFNIFDQEFFEAYRRPFSYYSGLELHILKVKSKIDRLIDFINPNLKFKLLYNGRKIIKSQKKPNEDL